MSKDYTPRQVTIDCGCGSKVGMKHPYRDKEHLAKTICLSCGLIANEVRLVIKKKPAISKEK